MKFFVRSTAYAVVLSIPALSMSPALVIAEELEARAAGEPTSRSAAKMRKPKGQGAVAAPSPLPSPRPAETRLPRIPEGESARPQLEERGSAAVTRTSITSDALQASNAQNTYDAIRNVPGVAQAEARAGTADSLQIRGIKLNSTSSYRMDGGLPIVNNINLPIESKARIDALKGAGALQYGVASPAGIVNYIMKRATDKPVTALSVSGSQYGQMIGALDVGRRFGEDNQFGMRVNLAGGEIGSPIQGAGGVRYLGAVATDWQPSDRFKVIFDYERFGIDVVEQAPLLLNPAVNNKIVLPRVPKNDRLNTGSWARSVGYGENIFGRATADVGNGFSIIGEAGRSEGFRPQRAVAQIGNYNVVTGLGRGTVTMVEDQLSVNNYGNLAAKHQTSWEFIKNELTVGITHSERLFNNPQNPTFTFQQNIYDPFYVPAPIVPSGRTFLPNNSRNFDTYFQDQIDFFDRLHLFGGIRQINYTSETARRKGGGFDVSESTTYAPAAGIVFDVTPKISVYASYVSSLEETGQAPVQAVNAYSVLPPAPATQMDAGVRAELFGTQATVGAFKINRANATIDPHTRVYGFNGNIVYEGIEYTLARPITSELSVNTGGQIMKARQIAPDDPSIDGKTPENTPFFSGTAGVVYRPDWLRGLSLNGGVQYIGVREVNPQNQATLPANWLFNVGANYATRIGGRRVVFNLNVRNLTDKRYFSSVATGALAIGAPRTVTLSARVEF
ncbi:TonB-dependent receptor domain-containing protein [Bradyrhizobium erythrophlei]|uniref:TonB-dependent siderophore receptor n=1 Tax=Bradyrhizobium erythrophlei TaxID=1437360 RepID=UPI0035EC7B1C